MQETTIPLRCSWAQSGPLEIEYHDLEWGVPAHSDRLLFEFLLLEGAQAGLSWSTILRKREGYRLAFDNFEAEKIARYDEAKRQELMLNPGIVRNRAKIAAAIKNAQAFLAVQERAGSFDTFLWSFVDGQPKQNSWKGKGDIPVSTPESDKMSKELKRLGFSFVGTTICYSLMQAMGLVNDHTTECFRWHEVQEQTR